MIRKLIILLALSVGIGLWAKAAVGLSNSQTIAISIFLVSAFGTLLFWEFRLTFAFLGTSVLLIAQVIDLEHLIAYSSLEVILFLVGMMVLVALLKETGFFAWLVTLILRIKNLTANKFLVLICVMSALLACAIDEVTAIIFIVAAVFEICDYFDVEPTPFLIISVLCTNIGSAGTALGNPIGILIASKSGLSFEDFLIKAFPVMIICLAATIVIVRFWYRKPISKLDENMKELGANEILIKLISVPPDKKLKLSLAIFGVTLFFIAMHRRFELFWNLKPNTILLSIPLISSGLVMAWKWRKSREYIEKDVEWYTLIFFLLVFAKAGTLKYTGATDVLARHLVQAVGNNIVMLTGVILWISAIGSSILDNVVLVAALIPVIQSFKDMSTNLQPLWWALLFGGCFGGNITMVGSTANIVALGILEKEKKIKMTFFRWFWIGTIVGITTTAIVWVALITLPIYR